MGAELITALRCPDCGGTYLRIEASVVCLFDGVENGSIRLGDAISDFGYDEDSNTLCAAGGCDHEGPMSEFTVYVVSRPGRDAATLTAVLGDVLSLAKENAGDPGDPLRWTGPVSKLREREAKAEAFAAVLTAIERLQREVV
jgi:hypothetical protein